jgi:hypothetical protein
VLLYFFLLNNKVTLNWVKLTELCFPDFMNFFNSINLYLIQLKYSMV